MIRTILSRTLAAAALVSAGYFMGHDTTAVHAQSTRVFELRTYHCAPDKLPNLLTRFREHTTTIFEHHGMHNVGYFIPVEEPQKNNTLTYIISHESREQAKQNWKEFNADPEWQKVRTASEANGKIVEKVDSEFLTAADFSPTK